MELKSLYKTAVTQAEQEEEVLRKALQKITEIRNIKNERRIQVFSCFNHEVICLTIGIHFRLVMLVIKKQ